MSRIEFRPCFSAEHRVVRVRAVMYLSLVFMVFAFWTSAQLATMWRSGVEPNGEAISRVEVAALLIVIQAIAWAFLIGMHLYGRSYVVLIYRSRDDSHSIYETVGWMRRHQWFVDANEEQACKFHRGKTEGVYDPHTGVTLMSVDAPYYSQRVKSRRLPFILDADGVFLDD